MKPVIITLTDFGLARRELCPPKRMNTFCGSLDFLAPEMVRMVPSICPHGKKQGYGKEVDIWAIGIVAYAVMSGQFPFMDETPKQLLQSIVNDGVYFSSAWSAKSDVGEPPIVICKLMVAKRFVRCLLRKDAVSRPTAVEALSHPFITSSEEDLKALYEEMVMTRWTPKGKTDKNAKSENMVFGRDLGADKESQDALVEVNENLVESRERKRQFMEGKENDVEDEGDVTQMLKRRKVCAE